MRFRCREDILTESTDVRKGFVLSDAHEALMFAGVMGHGLGENLYGACAPDPWHSRATTRKYYCVRASAARRRGEKRPGGRRKYPLKRRSWRDAAPCEPLTCEGCSQRTCVRHAARHRKLTFLGHSKKFEMVAASSSQQILPALYLPCVSLTSSFLS